MENASKALLIAGGVLISILVFSLLLYARNNLSVYYTSQKEFKDIQNVTKFNKQFTNYERTDVKGYELISLINSVIDYNDRRSIEQANQDQAKSITIQVNFVSDEYRQKFLYNYEHETQTNSLFSENSISTYGSTTSSIYSNKKTFNEILEEIRSVDIPIIGNEEDMIKIAKDIKGIFNIDIDPTKFTSGEIEARKANAVHKYNSYITTTGKQITLSTPDSITAWANEWDQKFAAGKEIRTAVYHYYEYINFKKAVFKCTNIHYDTDSGKVDEMSFEFTGKIE